MLAKQAKQSAAAGHAKLTPCSGAVHANESRGAGREAQRNWRRHIIGRRLLELETGQNFIADRGVDPDRLEHYRRLGREAAFEERKRDKATAAEHKRKWKQLHQAQKVMYRDRHRG